MKDVIEKKLQELAQQKEQALAQLNAILGAEQALNALLEEADKKDGD